MMKRGFIIFIFIIALGMISSLPSALAGPGHSDWGGSSYRSSYAYYYYGGNNPSAYNPSAYNPYVYSPTYPFRNQDIQDPTQQKYSYEWIDVTRYPGWYEDPEVYQQIYGKFGQGPRKVTSPYRDVRKPSPSEVLTSPYED